MNILNKFFDRIYCITVYDFYDRHEHVKKQLQEVEFDWIFSPPSQFISPPHPPLGPTEISLMLGHMTCVWDAKMKGYEKIAIWEDDGMLIASEDEMQLFFDNVPLDWECLYMGNASWNDEFSHLNRRPISEYVDLILWGTGSSFNAIRSSMYDLFIEEMMKFTDPVDFTFYKLFERLRSYSPVKGFFSDPISYPNEHALEKITRSLDVTKYFPAKIIHGA